MPLFDKDSNVIELIISLRHFEGRQKGFNIATDMEELIHDINTEVCQSDVGYYITDNTANIVKACKLFYTKVNSSWVEPNEAGEYDSVEQQLQSTNNQDSSEFDFEGEDDD